MEPPRAQSLMEHHLTHFWGRAMLAAAIVFGPMRAAVRGTSYSDAIPFSANSSLALWFFSRCVRPMPRRTLGALVNWTFE